MGGLPHVSNCASFWLRQNGNVQYRGMCQFSESRAPKALVGKVVEVIFRCGFILRTLCVVLTVGGGLQQIQAAEVTLIWEPSPEEAVSTYRVYYGLESRFYLGFVETDEGFSAHITGLEDGATYYFAATAVTQDGAESDYSNEVQWTTPPPLQPTFGVVSVDTAAAVLTGRGAPGGTYEIEWSPDLMTWASLEIVVVPDSGSFVVEHLNPPPGACFYRRVWLDVGELVPPSDRDLQAAD